MPHHPWLNRLEYVSIAASVAGVVTTAITQQVVFAAAPIVFTLGINSAQRRQLQTHCNTLLDQVESLSTTSPDPPPEISANPDFLAVAAQIATLEAAIAQQQALTTDIAEIRSQFEQLPELTTTTSELQAKWQQLPTQMLQNLPTEFAQLQAVVRSLQTQFAQLEKAMASETEPAWQQEVQQLRSQLEGLITQIATTPPPELEPSQIDTPEQKMPSPATPESTSQVSAVDEFATDELITDSPASEESTPQADETEAQLRPNLDFSDESDDSSQPETVKTAPPTIAPPTVPPQYRRESLEPEPPQPEPEPTPANTAPSDRDRPSPAPDQSSAATERAEPKNSQKSGAQATDNDDDWQNGDLPLPPELEAGVREIGENLREMGKSIRQTWDRFAQTVESEANPREVTAWQLTKQISLPNFSPQAIAFNTTGQHIAYVNTQSQIQVTDWQETDVKATVQPQSSGITAIAFNPKNQTLLVGQTDGNSTLWDGSSGELRHTFQSHTLPVTAVSFSPHGKTCATASADKTIALWDVGTGQLLRSLKGHWDRVTSLAFSPDGQSLISGSEDGTIKRWDVLRGEKSANAAPGGVIQSVAVSTDGQWLASGGDRQISLWTTNTLAEKVQHRVLRKVVTVATATQGAGVAAIAGQSLHLWDSSTSEKIATLNIGQHAIAIHWQPEALLCVTETGTLQVWQSVASTDDWDDG